MLNNTTAETTMDAVTTLMMTMAIADHLEDLAKRAHHARIMVVFERKAAYHAARGQETSFHVAMGTVRHAREMFEAYDASIKHAEACGGVTLDNGSFVPLSILEGLTT